MRLAIALGLRKSDFPMTPIPSRSRFRSRAGAAPDPASSGNGGGALEADPGGAAQARCGRADLQRGCGGGAAMFARGAAVALVQPQWGQVRNMATLKDITRRLKSIKNIQKITKSMKMVSAAKYARAERELKPARVYGTGALSLYEKAEIKAPEDKKKHLLIGVSSDRGLCGAIHTSIAKTLKNEITNLSNAGKEVMVVGVGDKIRGLLQRTHSNYFLLTFKEVGRRPPSFGDASVIALELLNSGFEFDEGSVIYNRFRSVISYKTDEKPIFSFETVASSESLSIYDDIDADVLRNYQEFTLANILYYSLKESTTSEQSARMTAMDNASKNASEMIDKLTLTFNRTRQAVITKELIEIISGAAAL
ncbi:ATP synthase subunit gamma, mitochondrial-like isoform X3 [Poecile atricapillus]|nr:ATP synthase subunit gamma, mitochondrial-like isoform X2 [Poecile atricapillus]XP_058718636.1 ATP synthase subunit gamma, mitochondrial-like isoform X3 [Poecile atricapillus]